MSSTNLRESVIAPNVVIIRAGWHQDIVASFTENCIGRLDEYPEPLAIKEFEVPGVVEIPLFARKIIDRGLADVLIVTGLIADHGVYRHDFVARTVMDATMNLQMSSGIPIIYGILTPQEFLSEGRETFFREHFVTKGIEAADACMKTLCNDKLLDAV